MIKIIRYVATNDRGLRIGEGHQRAKLTDREIEEMRDLHEAGVFNCPELGQLYGVCRWYAWQVVKYVKRVQTAAGHRAVRLSDDVEGSV